MNLNQRYIRVLALVACTILAHSVRAAQVAVPYFSQISNQWCWDASSEMVLAYYGVSQTQPQIAAYGSNGRNVPNYLYGSSPATATKPALNGVDLILKNFAAINTTPYARALTANELQTEI